MSGSSELGETLDRCIETLHATFERSDLEVEQKKILQKLDEARYNPGDATPLADCILSLFLAARSRGFSAGAMLRTLEKVAKANTDRRWKKMPDGTYHAV